jgi:hypothetical protein
MSWLGNILGSGVGTLVDQISGSVDKFVVTGKDKQKFELDKQNSRVLHK